MSDKNENGIKRSATRRTVIAAGSFQHPPQGLIPSTFLKRPRLSLMITPTNSSQGVLNVAFTV